MKNFLTVILTIMLLSLSCDACGKGKEFKLLYWNIQNGMWHDQGNGYDGFVKFVQELDPDICVWCEAETRYVTDKDFTKSITQLFSNYPTILGCGNQ